MRVAFVTHNSSLYGANRSLLSLIDGLESYGVEPYVIVPSEGAFVPELIDRKIPYFTILFKRWMSQNRWKASARLGLNLAVLPFLARRARQWEVDLIYTNSSVTPIGMLLAEVLSLPHIWHVREFGNRDFGLFHDWGKSVFQTFMNRTNAVIAVSEAVRRHVLSDVTAPCHVIYNGVISHKRLKRLEKDTKARVNEVSSPYTFAIVGQISPAKGQRQALRALHHLKLEGKNVRLLVAGSGAGEHVESLRELCQSLNLNREVTFLGYVSDPFEVYQQANAVLMCSPHEAMGRVTAEAMAAGRPVIGWDSDGTAELIEDGHNGLLYDGTRADLADCMHLFVDNPGWARALGMNGWEKARTEYTNEIYAHQVYKVLCKSCTAGKR